MNPGDIRWFQVISRDFLCFLDKVWIRKKWAFNAGYGLTFTFYLFYVFCEVFRSIGAILQKMQGGVNLAGVSFETSTSTWYYPILADLGSNFAEVIAFFHFSRLSSTQKITKIGENCIFFLRIYVSDASQDGGFGDTPQDRVKTSTFFYNHQWLWIHTWDRENIQMNTGRRITGILLFLQPLS